MADNSDSKTYLTHNHKLVIAEMIRDRKKIIKDHLRVKKKSSRSLMLFEFKWRAHEIKTLKNQGNFFWRKSAIKKLVGEIDAKKIWANCEAAIFWRLFAFRFSPFAKVWWNWQLVFSFVCCCFLMAKKATIYYLLSPTQNGKMEKHKTILTTLQGPPLTWWKLRFMLSLTCQLISVAEMHV